MSPSPLTGKTAVVTGANSGIGYALAAMLAAQGAHVVMACRDMERGRRALQALQKGQPGAKFSLLKLDLADLDSVRRLAETCERDLPCIDLLVLNAGIMAPPQGWTRQGFELQMGVNHLGHFALTGLLLPLLRNSGIARVTIVGSNAAMDCKLELDDLAGRSGGYDPVRAYCKSKRAQMLFATELSRRVDPDAFTVTSADPGYTRTALQRHVPDLLRRIHARYTQWRYAHPAQVGAERVMRAITDPHARNGLLFQGLDSAPVALEVAFPDTAEATQLWQQSEQVTGIHFKF
ncbi:MAG: SDR family NAD(P)-dependent oxidoreductase [Bacteroidia bacterium]